MEVYKMSTPRSKFDKDLLNLNKEILKMGAIIEQQIDEATASLINQDKDLAEKVIQRDDDINKLHYFIEDHCIGLIIHQQPLAKDLRRIFTAIKISTDLERISDIAVNIAHIAKDLWNQHYVKPLIDIPQMAKTAREIIKLALDSYVQKDTHKAKGLTSLEEYIDSLYSQIFRELLLIMIERPKTISQGTQLLLVGRHLERIGDHSTNIGEMVIYQETGQRIKLN